MEKEKLLVWTKSHLDLAEVGDKRAIVQEGDHGGSWDKKLAGSEINNSVILQEPMAT